MRVKNKVLSICISLCATFSGATLSFLPFDFFPAVIAEINTATSGVTKEDVRVTNINNYFATNGLPLAGYGKTFVEVADKYDLDYRLLPAIAMRESTGGKQACWNDKDNVFGWASCKVKFDTQEQAIDKVGAHLSGNIKSTSSYYGNKSVWKKLRTYNSVIAPYPDQVIGIMNKIERTPIDEQVAIGVSKEVAMK